MKLRLDLKSALEQEVGTKILNTVVLSGSSSSQTYLLITAEASLFCKINLSANAWKMFCSEKEGLDAIKKAEVLKTPKIYCIGDFENGAFMVLEHIETKTPEPGDWHVFGRQLAELHQTTSSEYYGWRKDNFIGSLFQINKPKKSWTAFYLINRLLPQLKLAVNQRRLKASDIPSENKLEHTLTNLLSCKAPSLIHGDLWSGNFLIDKSGAPVLIDPSISYGDPNVDIAMSKLFGGFGNSFYDAYYTSNSSLKRMSEDQEIYQLYYLLVHLNLFGANYYSPVIGILRKYFQ